MWYLKACRACLTTGSRLERMDVKARRTFSTVTDLAVEEGDGLPQFLCVECYAYIRKILAFRRKSRRAHFVLKEIQLVKKQVTQDDILIVDRKKTNLISALSKDSKTIALYTYTTADVFTESPENVTCEEPINPEQSQEKDSEPQTLKLIREDCGRIKDCSVLVDIKPANYKEIEREEAEARQREIEKALQEIHEDSGNDFGEVIDVDDHNSKCDEIDPKDIDLEDVFKGLKEDEDCDTDFEYPEKPYYDNTRVSEKIKYRKKSVNAKIEEDNHKLVKFMSFQKVNRVAQMLFISKITYLNTEEQKKAHKLKMEEEPYKSALFKCGVCLETFDMLPKLQSHALYHNKRREYKYLCRICNDRFEHKENLEQHSAENHWYKYSCGHCKGTHYCIDSLFRCSYLRKETGFWQLNLNMESKLPESLLQKYFTLTVLSQEDQIKTTMHWTEPVGLGLSSCRYLCVICKIGFSNLSDFKVHNEHHVVSSSVYVYQCDICKIKMKNVGILENHMINWHLYQYACKKCTKVCWNRQQATHHYYKVHIPTKQPTYQDPTATNLLEKASASKKQKKHKIWHCNSCKYQHYDKVMYFKHILKKHGYIRLGTVPEINNVNYHCSVCNLYFKDEKVYYSHLYSNKHDRDKIKNLCTECLKNFVSREELSDHVREKHSAYPKPCDICGDTLETKQQEGVHMFRTHPSLERTTGNGRLCELCGKVVSNYKMHKQTHELEESPNEIYHKCRFCDYKNKSVENYIMHILASHTYRPYCCTICGRRMTTRCESRDHVLKIHAPVRPYMCKACDRYFSHLDYLNSHCIKMHGVDIKKTDKSVFLPRMKDNVVYVYPHLKIDGSLIEQEKLALAKIESCDYMDGNRNPIDYSEAFFFDPNVDPNAPTRLNRKIKNPVKQRETTKYWRKKKRQQRMNKIAQANTLPEEEDKKNIDFDNAENLLAINNKQDIDYSDIKIDFKAKDVVMKDQNVIVKEEIIEQSRGFDMPSLTEDGLTDPKSEFDVNDYIQQNVEVEQETAVEEQMEIDECVREEVTEEQNETEDVLGELIEQDGQYYVIVDGLLYKLENN